MSAKLKNREKMSGSLSRPTAHPFSLLSTDSVICIPTEPQSPVFGAIGGKRAFGFQDLPLRNSSQEADDWLFGDSFNTPHAPRGTGEDSPLSPQKTDPFAFGSCFNLSCHPALPDPELERTKLLENKLKEAYIASSIENCSSPIMFAKNPTERVYKVLKITNKPQFEGYGALFKTLKGSSFDTPFPLSSLENRVIPVVNEKKDLLLLEAKNPTRQPRNREFVKIMEKMVLEQITPKTYFCLRADSQLDETVLTINGKDYSNYPQEPVLDGEKMLVKRARGGDFLSYLERWKKSTTPGELNDFCIQLLNHVDRMHDLMVFHRDIKPDNLVVSWKDTGEKKIQLIDFGFATQEVTSFRDCGTRAYMAPELCKKWFLSSRGEKHTQKMAASAVEPRLTDLYALGITLYEILTLNSFQADLKHFAKNTFTPDGSSSFHEFFANKQKAIDQFLDNPSIRIKKKQLDVIKGFLRFEPQNRMSLKEAIRIWNSP